MVVVRLVYAHVVLLKGAVKHKLHQAAAQRWAGVAADQTDERLLMCVPANVWSSEARVGEAGPANTTSAVPAATTAPFSNQLSPAWFQPHAMTLFLQYN